MSFKKVLVLGVQLAVSVSCAYSSETIRFSGRNDLSNADEPVLYWSGASVSACFNGTSLGVTLDDLTGDNFYQAILDGAEDSPIVIDCKPGVHTYPLASNLGKGSHEVLLFRRTEGHFGATIFLGFELDEGCELEPLPSPLPARRIEFYGDSITCGMGNEAPDDENDQEKAHQNNYLAYGAITARNLHADYRCIARSGIGMVKSWYDLVMPEMWDRLDPEDPLSRWDFSRWTPHVVVVNLFQNDSWLVSRMDPVPAGEQLVQAYKEFISGIREVYPEAHIVCALGNMDATRAGSPWPGYIHRAVVQLGDSNVSECTFPFKTWRKHPRIRHHREMAEQLTVHIQKVMAWE